MLAVIASIHLLPSWGSAPDLRTFSPGSLLETRRKENPARSFHPNFFFSTPPFPPPVQSLNYLKEQVLFPHSKLSRLYLPLVVKVEAVAQAISGVCDVCFSPSEAELRAGRLSPELSLGIRLADIKMINLAALMFSSSPLLPANCRAHADVPLRADAGRDGDGSAESVCVGVCVCFLK